MLLVIDTNLKNANTVTDLLRYMGFLAYPATPSDALSEFSNLYTAVVIVNPADFPDIKDYVSRLRSFDNRMMLFSLSDGENPCPELFALNFKNNIYSRTFAQAIIKYCEKNSDRTIGCYRTSEFEVSAGMHDAVYKGITIPFTKMELRIIRFLLHTNPEPQMTDVIIKYVYPASKRPEHSGLRTHISHINGKFRKATGQNLIEMKPKAGYYLLIVRDFIEYLKDFTTMYF